MISTCNSYYPPNFELSVVTTKKYYMNEIGFPHMRCLQTNCEQYHLWQHWYIWIVPLFCRKTRLTEVFWQNGRGYFGKSSAIHCCDTKWNKIYLPKLHQQPVVKLSLQNDNEIEMIFLWKKEISEPQFLCVHMTSSLIKEAVCWLTSWHEFPKLSKESRMLPSHCSCAVRVQSYTES